MLKIEIKDGNIEKALKVYKRKVIKTKQLKDLRDNRYHTKQADANHKLMTKQSKMKEWNKKNREV